MYESRYASREDIDAAMTLGCGLPMGPLALMDLIGLDTAYEILDTMYKQGRDRLHAPSPLLKQMVTAGLRGRKSGRGFYTYAEPGSSQVVPDALTPSDATTSHVDLRGDLLGGGRRLRDDGHRDRRGRRQGRVRRVRRGAQRGEVRGGAGRRRQEPREGRRARESSSRPTPTPRWRACAPPPRCRTSHPSTSSSRPWWRTSRSSGRCSPTSTPSAGPVRCWPRPRPRSRWWSAQRPPPARPTWSGCTSSTPRR